MSDFNVAIWCNVHNPDSLAFANYFKDDLKKCTTRFGLTSTVFINPESISSDANLLIVTAKDEAHEEYVSACRNLIQAKGLKLILAEPTEKSLISTLSGLTPINFWDKIYTTGEVRLFRRNNIETQTKYWERITDIAIDFTQEGSIVESKYTKGKVFLSQEDISTSSDRDNLRRDLNDLGYAVLPDKPLSTNIDECTMQIKDALEKSNLIIHIIPPIYTPFFINQHLSLAEHQCNITADFLSKSKRKVPRFIWISSAYEIIDEENLVFVEKIQRDEEQTRGSKVLKTSIEDLKKDYRDVLSFAGDSEKDEPQDSDVYVIFDSISNGHFDTVQGIFSGKKLKVETNHFGITYNQHLTKLATAKIVVLCYTCENLQWLSVKVNDILKSRGLDSSRPFEKIVLVKTNQEFQTQSFEGFFTNIYRSISELAEL